MPIAFCDQANKVSLAFSVSVLVFTCKVRKAGCHDSSFSIQLGTRQTDLCSSDSLKPSVLILEAGLVPTWTSVGAASKLDQCLRGSVSDNYHMRPHVTTSFLT